MKKLLILTVVLALLTACTSEVELNNTSDVTSTADSTTASVSNSNITSYLSSEPSFSVASEEASLSVPIVDTNFIKANDGFLFKWIKSPQYQCKLMVDYGTKMGIISGYYHNGILPNDKTKLLYTMFFFLDENGGVARNMNGDIVSIEKVPNHILEEDYYKNTPIDRRLGCAMCLYYNDKYLINGNWIDKGHGGGGKKYFYDEKTFYRLEDMDGGSHATIITDMSEVSNKTVQLCYGKITENEEGAEYGTYISDTRDLFGFCDENGRIVVPLKYKMVSDIRGNLLAVKKDSDKMAIFNKQGEQLTDFIYDTVSLAEKYVCVSISGKYGYIDENGKEVIPLVCEDATRVVSGRCYIKVSGYWGIAEISVL